MKQLIICEKPSVAKDIAAAVGAKKVGKVYKSSEYIITNAIGHMMILDPPKMGFNKPSTTFVTPKDSVYKPNSKVKSQLDLIVKLINSNEVVSVVNNCDADRAGEAIFWNIYNYSKSSKPVKRFWSSDVLTKSTVLDNLSNLHDPQKYFPYAQAEWARTYSDLILGYNLSTLYAIKKHHFGLSLGRIQTPLLAEVVLRCIENETFVPATSYALNIKPLINATKGSIYASSPSTNSILIKPKSINVKKIRIVSITDSDESQSAPMLHDKSSIMVDASSVYKIPASKTAKALQELYDAKISSYPRTDSRYMDEKQSTKSKVFSILQSIGYEEDMAAMMKRGKSVFNDKEVKGHYALIILNGAKALSIIKGTPNGVQSKILKLLKLRMLTRFSPPVLYKQRIVKIEVDTEINGTTEQVFSFTLEGRKPTSEGWLKYHVNRKEKYDFNHSLFDLELENELTYSATGWSESTTRAPGLYTSGSLVKWMKANGIGTAATIETFGNLLVKKGYLKLDKSDKYHYTKLGLEIFHDVKDCKVSKKTNTSIMDSLMNDIIISDGEVGFHSQKDLIDRLIQELHKDLSGIELEAKLEGVTDEVLGSTPQCLCGSSDITKNFTFRICNTCKRKVSSTILGKKLSDTNIKDLMLGKKVKIEKMRSNRTKKLFSSFVLIDEAGVMNFIFK